MGLSNLTKEQKQYLILGVIVSAAVIVLIVFGIKVSLSSISEVRVELEALYGKIESAEKSVSRSELESSEFHATINTLEDYLASIPPERNYYSWATEIIYRDARMVGFDVDAIDEMFMAAPEEDAAAIDAVKVESYGLRITAHGGYENVKEFLRRMAVNHPLIRVTGIEISTGSNPEVHDVQLFIEWPFNLGYLTDTWKSAAPLASPDRQGESKQPHPPAARPGQLARTAPES